MEEKIIKTEKSIGQYLKSVREEKEVTISKISKKTCISEKLLMDVEADNFDDMGGLGYAKAMTISYAKALGANDKLVLHLFNSKYVKPVPRTLYKREQQPKKFMIPTSMFSILILIILIVVLTLIITRLYRDGDIIFPLRNKGEVTNVEKTVKMDLSTAKAVQLDPSALRDSNDYVEEYLEGKKSSNNVKK